jgi:hypothetical protein
MNIIAKILRDLTCDSAGRVVYEKLGAVTAHVVGSYVVLYQVHHGGPTEFVFLSYLAFAGGHAAFSKSQSLKYNQNKPTQTEKSE